MNNIEQTGWRNLVSDILPEGKENIFYANLSEKDMKIQMSQLKSEFLSETQFRHF